MTGSSFTRVLDRVFELLRQAGDQGQVGVLRSELQSLPAQSTRRLCALLNLGREQRELSLVHGSVPAKESAAPLDALALCDSSLLKHQYLERGYALACAANTDPETLSRQRFHKDEQGSVYQRAWSRFGRELARSEPADWVWFGRYKPETGELSKLYLRRSDKAWWSFAGGIDQPVVRQGRFPEKHGKSSKLPENGSDLQSLQSLRSAGKRLALQRALTSVRARLGQVAAPGAQHPWAPPPPPPGRARRGR